MKIAIDLRSLQSGSISGVENYALNLLDALLAMDNKNQYTLFYNKFSMSVARRFIGLTDKPINGHATLGILNDLHYVNSRVNKTHYPNRLLNLALMIKAVKLESVIDDFDCLFLPNLNQFNLKATAKLAITVHDLSPVVTPEFYDVKRNLWHRTLRFKQAFDRANIIFAVSEYTKLDLTRLFNVPAEKIKVVYPGIDHKVYHQNIPTDELRKVRNSYALPGEYILFLNTIEPRKNLLGVIEAFEALDTNASLVIAGRPGWKYRQILNRIKSSKKSAKIKYIGYVTEKDKPAIIKLASMLVYPSFYEGFGFQPLEAMGLGVPVMASQVTSLPEVLGDAALLVNPYNIGDLRTGMQKLLTDEELRQRLINKGLEQVKKYDWKKTAEQVLEYLNKI